MSKSTLEQVCNALGWQGGTIHQVLEEIKRLRELDKWVDPTTLGMTAKEFVAYNRLRFDAVSDEVTERVILALRTKPVRDLLVQYMDAWDTYQKSNGANRVNEAERKFLRSIPVTINEIDVWFNLA